MRWPFDSYSSLAVAQKVEHRTRKFTGGGERALKIDLHIHTSDDPEDRVRYSSRELIDRTAALGFDVISITNHNVITWSEDLADYAGRRGVLLIPGVEKTIEKRHVVIINARSEDLKIKSFKDLAAAKNGTKLIIAPHPFYPGLNCLRGKLVPHLPLFDAIEYSHYYTSSVNFNRKAVDLALEKNLPLIGTSDAHLSSQLGTTYSLVSAPKEAGSVLRAIRSGKVKIVTGPLSLSHAVKIRLALSLI
jgi:predicted metal-dependent phosphoesterase TrpH